LWAELGKQISFDRRFFLEAFGKDACGREHTIIRQGDCFALERESVREYVMTWPEYKEELN
jgi:ribosomal protein S14